MLGGVGVPRTERGGLFWTISCPGLQGTELATAAAERTDAKGRPVAVDFDVPADCTAQNLVLQARIDSSASGVQWTLSDLSVRPIAAARPRTRPAVDDQPSHPRRFYRASPRQAVVRSSGRAGAGARRGAHMLARGDSDPVRNRRCHTFFPASPRRSQRRPFRDPEIANHGSRDARRSEEHTSELQSLMRISYAVFCLTKKKKKHP